MPIWYTRYTTSTLLVYSYNRWYITIIDQKYTSTLVLRYFFENILLGKYILVDTKNSVTVGCKLKPPAGMKTKKKPRRRNKKSSNI